LGVPDCTFNADNFEVLNFQLYFDNDLVKKNLLITESNRYVKQNQEDHLMFCR